nr:unnamed protein product [Callosobruchus analis]
MYRQVIMDPAHRSLQQIVWRESPNDEFQTYQLNTVTYGTRSAPYLAIRGIKQLAEENLGLNPLACQTIINDVYVDDLLTGSNDLNELKRCKTIHDILASANFILRKWNSNNFAVISEFAEHSVPNSIINLGKQENPKTLETQWDNHSDSLKYKIKYFHTPNIITKRYILSTIAQIYDPLGLLSPTITLCKIMIQKLWSLHVALDSHVPTEIENQWIHFQNDLVNLNSFEIPRTATPFNHSLVDIHCFCDASTDAYAAAVYLRSINDVGEYSVNLLCSKTKVSPLKTITIPRLELCACLLGSQLVNIVITALSVSVPIHMCSDCGNLLDQYRAKFVTSICGKQSQ